jgi:hypothetical protein
MSTRRLVATPAARLAVLVGLLFLLSSATASAAPPDADGPRGADRSGAGDYLFPHAGDVSASFATGVPLLAIGELSYAFTDRFALGAVAAATPNVAGVRGTVAVGVRPRGVVFATGRWRAAIPVPVLYYPKVDGFGGDREPWMLTRPSLIVEHRFGSGARVSGGVGLIAAACTDSILTLGKEHTMMGGVWDTVSAGGAVPLSARTSLFAEASLVMRGVVPAADWIGVSPVVGFVGVSTEL